MRRRASGSRRSRSASPSASSPWILSKKEDDHEPQVFINPEIIWTSDEKATYEEGCLSIPEYYEEVERPAQVKVKYLDLDGKPQRDRGQGPVRDLPAARDRPHQRRAVHRSYLQAQARPRHQEIRQGGRRRRRRDWRSASSSWARPTSPCRRWSRSSARGHDVAAVYTRAPQPAGRGMALTPSPVAREAERFGLPVFTPKTLKDATPRARCARTAPTPRWSSPTA